MYKLDLDTNKKEYITQTQKKYFEYALKWCLENEWHSCRVNRIYYNFDFDNLKVNIVSVGGSNITYKMKEV